MSDSIFGFSSMRAAARLAANHQTQPDRLVETRATPSWSASTDVALLAIIEAPLGPGETAAGGFARKEAELRYIMETLTVGESRTLHSRLANPRPGDPLADAFLRMTADRRARLIHFLGDARRRAATSR